MNDSLLSDIVLGVGLVMMSPTWVGANEGDEVNNWLKWAFLLTTTAWSKLTAPNATEIVLNECCRSPLYIEVLRFFISEA